MSEPPDELADMRRRRHEADSKLRELQPVSVAPGNITIVVNGAEHAPAVADRIREELDKYFPNRKDPT